MDILVSSPFKHSTLFSLNLNQTKMNRSICLCIFFVCVQLTLARPTKREDSGNSDHLPNLPHPHGIGHVHFGPGSFYFSDKYQECFRGVESLNCLVMMANGHESIVQVDNGSGKVHMNFGTNSFFHTIGHHKCFVNVDYLNCTLNINGEENKIQIDRQHGHRNIIMNIGDYKYHHYHVDPNRHDHFLPNNFKKENNDQNNDQNENYSLLLSYLRSFFKEQLTN